MTTCCSSARPQGDPEVEQHLVRGMLDRGVGGFLYAALYTREVTPLAPLRSQPLVLMNCVSRQKRCSAVVPDEVGGGRTAARVLLEAGHRDGIFLVGETPDDVIAGARRRDGIEAALAEAGSELAGRGGHPWWPERRIGDVRLFASGVRPTAFVCMNDRIALGVEQACRESGLAVPQDMSLISFDDSDLAAWSRPGLTSVAIPHLELGRRATELLLEPEPTPQVHRLEMPLTVRDSVAAPRHAPADGPAGYRELMAERPWLLIDVDGVLNPLVVADGFDIHEFTPLGWTRPPLQVQLTRATVSGSTR